MNSSAIPPPKITIANRPFSVEPYTGIMLPDGIFDAALTKQVITCFVTNSSVATINSLSVYLEGVSDLGINLKKETIQVANLQPGAAVKVSWLADFSRATPGKPWISIRTVSDGGSFQRLLKQIFVSRTHYDSATKTYICEVPEGTLQLQFDRLTGPKHPADLEAPPNPGPWLVTAFTATVIAPFSGKNGPIPFQDPIWKVIFAIIAVLAFLGALLASDSGSENSSTVRCDTDPATGLMTCQAPATTKQVLFILAGAAARAALSDRRDPWIRGREATNPDGNEKTLAEIVSATINYPDEITAGQPNDTDVSWSYQRITNAKSHAYSVKERVQNEYIVKSVVIHAPPTVSLKISPDLRVEAQITRGSGLVYKGSELIASVWLQAPNGRIVKLGLADDGIGADSAPNDGWYAGEISMYQAAESARLSDPRGTWIIYALAQTVNLATEQMTAVEASQFMGGDPVVAPLSLSFGGKRCTPGHSISVEVTD
jgi:hypothetical protein